MQLTHPIANPLYIINSLIGMVIIPHEIPALLVTLTEGAARDAKARPVRVLDVFLEVAETQW